MPELIELAGIRESLKVNITRFTANVRLPTISLRKLTYCLTTSRIKGLLVSLGHLTWMHFMLVCQQSVPSVERLATFAVTPLDFAGEFIPLWIMRPCVPLM
jgi:hypothetical protein